MAKKIEISGSALIVTDTVSGIIELSQPRRDMWYSEDYLENNDRIQFFDANLLKGEFIHSDELAYIDISDAVDSTLTPFTKETFREFAINNLRSAEPTENGTSLLGWAQYTDDQYTSVSPLVIAEGATTTIDINGASTIKSQLPTGVSDLYDVATSKITPVKVGDGYNIRLDFSAFTTSPSGLAKLKIDIGDGITPNVIVNRAFTFPKGTGLANKLDYSTTSFVYSLNTFFANGASLQIESIVGDTSIYDVNLVISRVNVGR